MIRERRTRTKKPTEDENDQTMRPLLSIKHLLIFNQKIEKYDRSKSTILVTYLAVFRLQLHTPNCPCDSYIYMPCKIRDIRIAACLHAGAESTPDLQMDFPDGMKAWLSRSS
jgi:hypothetical protein